MADGRYSTLVEHVAYLAAANEIGYVLSTVRPAFEDEPRVVAAIDALTDAVAEWRESLTARAVITYPGDGRA